MTDTFEEAARVGLGTHYSDAFGREVEVPESALRLILDKLALPEPPCGIVNPCVFLNEGEEVMIPLANDQGAFWALTREDGEEIVGEVKPGESHIRYPTHLPIGYHNLTVKQGGVGCESRIIVAPHRAFSPWEYDQPKRVWGVAAQLYALRSGTNWGIGDFTDLATLVAGVGRMGASVVGVNPLHAVFPDDPERASPYSPSSRQYLNWLYLDIEALPEFKASDEAKALVAAHEFQHELARLRSLPLVDYSGVANAKRRVLEIAYAQFQSAHLRSGDTRDRAFSAFRTSHGAPLRRFALFHAMREILGATDWSQRDWRNWPVEYRHPDSPAVAAFADEHLDRVEFHEYVQFCLFEQLAGVKEAALRADMSIGMYGDLAVGTDIAGAEGWSSQDIIVKGLDIGAPPDPLAPHGQNWGLPVFNPEALRRLGYEPFVRVLRSVMQSFGALRIDHVLGLYRLYCIPAEDPMHGAYLRCPFDDLLRIVALESHRNKCIVIGEDLGNLPEGLRETLIDHNILSYRVLWFEQYPDVFIPSEAYPAQSLVTISTHDLPTMAGFWTMGDIGIRRSLNLMNDEQVTELRGERTAAKKKLSTALHRAALLAEADCPDHLPASEIYRFVARTPSSMMMVQLEDILQQIDQANMPGTNTEHPNWRRKMPLDLPALLAEQNMRSIAVIAQEEGRTDRKVVLPPPNTVDPRLAIPASTYRLQFSAAFTFKDAVRIIPYLAQLGISHVYASSYLAARTGSTHGYDVVDHNAINPEIGTEDDFKEYLNALNSWRMGQILDFVPNHMGVGKADNQWWMDVLEWGQDSHFAKFFDIDWQGSDPAWRGKVLLPVLGEAFGDTVMSGALKLTFEPQLGTFSIWYGEHRFPIRPADYGTIIKRVAIPEIQQYVTAFDALNQSGIKRPSRRSHAAGLKAELAQAVVNKPELVAAFETAAASFSGTPGDRESWADYVRLIEKQNYRLTSWRLASDEINYRRFFDINDLAGIRVEDDDLFELMHRMLARLVAQGALHGVRIDHIDGLYDPASYLVRLYKYLGRFGAPANTRAKGRDRFYILVEKILAVDEELRATWPVAGTTGYEFTADTNALFVDPTAAEIFDGAYRLFTGVRDNFADMAITGKHDVMRDMLPADLSRLSRRLKAIADRDWNSRDFSLSRLRIALYEVVRGFRVYRTYVTAKQTGAEDRQRISQAVGFARENWKSPDSSVLDFIEKTLTGDLPREPGSVFKRNEIYEFVQAFQQYTGPVMAKSLEDTAFYRYFRLVSLNEVGNDPGRFGIGIEDFHKANALRARHVPNSMLASSTHDTKRGEDTRARINVLSELGAEWPKILDALHAEGLKLKTGAGPVANDEYMIYQTLLGVWPDSDKDWKDLTERLKQYVTKAIREAKLYTSWTNPNDSYEQDCMNFVEGLTGSREFLAVAAPVAKRVIKFGYLNSLSQTLLKLTAPGMPDIYQGSELWNLSLADPDNRRVVDYDLRARMIAEAPALHQLMKTISAPADMQDAAIKLRLVQRLCSLRRKSQELFETGGYKPVLAAGIGADNVIAFTRDTRDQMLFVACGRLMMRREVAGTKPDAYAWDWEDTSVAVPDGDWRDLLNGGKATGGTVSAGDLFGTLPIAVWGSGIH
jgi:(1->4)-alpha-D-glucan 1-alpha-D-glucosylmutase